MHEGELVFDQPEGKSDVLYHDEQPIYPSSYNIANPVPPIPVQNHNPLPYQPISDHLNQVSYDSYQPYITNQNIIHNPNDNNINTSNDTTYLLVAQNYLNDQHQRHSYLASPGRTMSSCTKPKITLKSFIINTYSFLIIIIDYIILPLSILLLLATMVFMILDQCSNKIINEYTGMHANNDNQITSNCQCAINQHNTQFDNCVCNGIDDNEFYVTHNGLIRIFCVTVLVFLVEYLSFMFFIFYALCKCLCCCGKPCCCLCWVKLKFTSNGYILSILSRIIECVACWYYMHVNSQNVNCHCPYNDNVGIINPDYCGPWRMDKYMQVLWQFCLFYLICCVIFLTGRLVVRCLISKKKHSYQYLELVRMVFYKK